VSEHDQQLFELQETLYESRNPTRRTLHRQRRDWIIDAIHRYGNGASSALEVGPGSGVYLPTLTAAAHDVVASDIEHAYLDRLEPLARRHANLRLVWDDITKSAFDDGAFDLIVCSEVVEHIADARPALREMHRVLSPTGTLILSTPQRYSPLELASKIAFLPGVITIVRRIYREPIMETGHINLMTNRRLCDDLHDAGFAPVEQWLAGVYLPVVAELLGERAVRLEAAVERRLRRSRLRGLLWTQFVVAQRAEAARSRGRS
jgi:2-polyprenyl-3-methyl-5-hydroxy-6-metoxy-1,4-benzoquinol methylase